MSPLKNKKIKIQKSFFREMHLHSVTTQTQSTTTASYFSIHLMATV